MKKFTSLLIGCSLALAGAAWAQQPEEQPTPKGKKGAAEKTTHGAQATPGAKAAKPQERPAKQTGATNEPGAGKGRKARAKSETPAGTETNVSGQPAGGATPGAEQPRKGMKGRAAKTSTTPATTPAAASASVAPTGAGAGQQNAQANVAGGTKKADPQKVQQVKAQAQQIKAQHTNFRAQPKPQQVPAVTFNQNYRIQGSDQWQGPQYDVFRSYHPERHDQGWYRSLYT